MGVGGLLIVVFGTGYYLFASHNKTLKVPLQSRFVQKASAEDTVNEFYLALKEQNSRQLNLLFAPDLLAEDASLRSRLFSGKDVDGTLGGPTFEQSNAATFELIGYAIQSKKEQNYSIIEKRQYVDGIHTVNIALTLIELRGKWRVSEYTYAGTHGVYSAFMLE